MVDRSRLFFFEFQIFNMFYYLKIIIIHNEKNLSSWKASLACTELGTAQSQLVSDKMEKEERNLIAVILNGIETMMTEIETELR